jgi:hypothetical protein
VVAECGGKPAHGLTQTTDLPVIGEQHPRKLVNVGHHGQVADQRDRGR